jgi:hypothetical protein
VDKEMKYVYNWLDCSRLNLGDIVKLTDNKECEFIQLNKDNIIVKLDNITQEVSVMKFKKLINKSQNSNKLGIERSLLRMVLREGLISFTEFQTAYMILDKNSHKKEIQC